MSWTLARDDAYQGEREVTLDVVSVAPVDRVKLWFRFCDATDTDYWTCYIYISRDEAITDPPPVAGRMGTTDDHLKVVYKKPEPIHLVFSNGVTIEMFDMGGGRTAPWLGEVFSYIFERTAPRTEPTMTNEALRRKYRPNSLR